MRPLFLRAPEDGTGTPPAAAGSAADPAALDSAAAQPATTDSQAPAAAGYRPENLPDHLLGADDKDTIDRIFRAYSGARETIGQRGEVPKDAAGYSFEPSEAVKPYAAGLESDPLWGKVKEHALKAGVPTKQFNTLMNGIMGELVAGEMVAEPFNADKERALLVPDESNPAKRATAADRIVRENIARVNAWKGQGMPEAVAASLLTSMDRASTNQLVAWIAGERREQAPVLTGGAPAGGALSQADLEARMRDSRNSVNSAKYDPAFAAETTEMFKRAYPG